MDILLQQVINGLVLGSMYALIALGYTMVYGIIQLINFAHGEVLMVGALTSWSCIGLMQEAMPGAPGWLILLLATVIACVVAAALNFVIDRKSTRLNSSHLVISYAVFCLKKKKNNIKVVVFSYISSITLCWSRWFMLVRLSGYWMSSTIMMCVCTSSMLLSNVSVSVMLT